MDRFYTAEDVRQMAQEYHVKFVRLQFTDILGALKNIAVTVEELEKALAGQVRLDGAALEGFREHLDRTVYLVPDPSTFVVFPWRPRDGAVARLICEALAGTDPFPACSRTALRRVLGRLPAGWQFMVGVEAAFFLFHTGEQGKPTTTTHDLAGYCDLTPIDLGENARRDMVLTLEEMGIEVTSSHHETAPGQHAIGLKDDTALAMADKLATFKFVVRTVAQRHGLWASFMPRPLTAHKGSGLILSLSLWRDGENLFRDPRDPSGLSETAYHFAGGVLQHARALTALANPLVNSYKRLVPDPESPFLAAWSRDSRLTMLRVDAEGDNVRLVLRSPDPAGNSYLVLAAVLAAGLDGIEHRVAPPPFANFRPADLNRLASLARDGGLPRTLGGALEALAADAVIRTAVGEEICRRFLDVKWQEWEAFLREVHPWETAAYLARY
ncbi:MAG: glutamine synthetase family protein [Bacillota bacterium]